MAFANKLLANGQLTNSPTDVLAPSGKKFLVHNIALYNSTLSGITVTISRNDGTTTRVMAKPGILSADTLFLSFSGEGLVVEDGDKLIMESDTATSANYFIDGCEET